MNAYWDAVRPYVVDGVVRGPDGPDNSWREHLRSMYAMTVSDPGTVAFVAEHVGIAGIDPMAGNGWWTDVLLNGHGCCVFPSDITPAHATAWTPVRRRDAVDAAGEVRAVTLLLSWPPRHHDVGERTIRAYRGPRIVHMGAQGRTSDGTDEMRQLLADEWVEIARHTPVRWFGVKDFVTVHERKEA